MTDLFRKEDIIDLATLRANITADPTYGVYILNTARIAVDSQQYTETGIESPIASDYIEAALNINIGTLKEPHLINIPPTWIPISLADYGEPLEIVKSQGFKGMCEARHILLITKEAYNRIMEDEGAQATRDHLLSVRHQTSVSQTDTQLLDQINKAANKRVVVKKEAVKKPKAVNLSAIVHELVAKSDTASHSALFSKYKSVEPRLSEMDLDHIVKFSSVPKMKKAAEARLNALKD